MSEILHCNNKNCSVSLFKKPIKENKQRQCPLCKSSDVEHIDFKEGIDEFHCQNSNCTEYQVNPMISNNLIFVCPFCRSKNIEIKKHDYV